MHTELLVRTKYVGVLRHTHPDPAEPADGEEIHQGYGVHVVESGTLHVAVPGQAARLQTGAAFIGRPGDVQKFSHPDGYASDVCLSAFYTWRFEHDHPNRNPLSVAGRLVHAPNNRVLYLRLRFENALNTSDPFAVEEWACELSDTVLREPAPSRLYRNHSLRWYQRRVDDARDIFTGSSTEKHSFVEVAHIVGMSPYHFSRIFREMVGVPPHQYLVRARLNRAQRMLREGSSVTDACYDSGFSNLSHFVRTFKHHFQVLPSQLKLSRRP